jgi:hypothetical protein
MTAKHLQKQRGRGQGRPFARGVSGNPAGRPPGARNRATEIAQALLDGEADALARKCIELALEGDRAALKLCLERLVPRRPRAVAVDLPAIASTADLAPAIAAIAHGVATGGLTPMTAPSWRVSSTLTRMPPSSVSSSAVCSASSAKSRRAMLRRISRVLLRRLDRVAAVVEGWQRAHDEQKAHREARELFVALLMGGLRDAGIDPATVPAMRRFDAPKPPVDPPVHRRPLHARDVFFAKLAELARRCRQDPPSLADATPLQLFAMYCFDESLVAQAEGG